MVVEHAEYTRQCVAAAMREQAKKDAEKRAKRPEAIQAASIQHELLLLLERSRQIQPEPFKVTNSIRCAQKGFLLVCICTLWLYVAHHALALGLSPREQSQIDRLY